MTDINQIKSLFKDRIDEMQYLISKTNKTSVLVIQQFPTEKDINTLLPNVRESVANILVFVELGNLDVLKEILILSDGIIDNIVMDADAHCSFSEGLIAFTKTNINTSNLFFYSDSNSWADSAISFLFQIEPNITKKSVLLKGEGKLTETIKRKLNDFNINWSNETDDNVDIILGTSIKQTSVEKSILKNTNTATQIFDIGIGNLTPDYIKGANELNATIYRIDNRAGISSVVLNILETNYLIKNVLGKTSIKGVELVAGGILGSDGAIILDDINSPTYIIGVADGKGFIKNDLSEKEETDVDFINRLINK